MYGFLVDGVMYALKKQFGEAVYDEIAEKGRFREAFVASKKYSETVIPRIIKVASDVTGRSVDELMMVCGKNFVPHVYNYGYDRLLRVLGRHYRDFLQTLDNLHDFLRFSFPRLNPPSFFCEREDQNGLILHYRSRRKGYTQYVIGQLKEVASEFYNTRVEIEVITEEESITLSHAVMRLEFNNTGFIDDNQAADSMALDVAHNTLNYDIMADVFPFHLVFAYDLLIKAMGNGLLNVIPKAIGQSVDEVFTLTKPMVEFTMENVLYYTNNVFELVTTDFVRRRIDTNRNTYTETVDEDEAGPDKGKRLKLKGQMIDMPDWKCVLFIATPMMDNLTGMFDMGLFINDLSIHDSSRDLVLASTQQQTELKRALNQEKEKNKTLRDTMVGVDNELKRTDALLYQMIPKSVAVRLRNGEPAMNTCQIFEKVTILFTDVVGFTSICSQLTPMGVVDMLNSMYTRFDNLATRHRVYKVETIGDAYMVVSGAPIVTKFHAIYISDMAFDMVAAMENMEDPSQGEGSNMRIRVGIHTGPVVGGIVGLKMPRYCLIGENVITANKMESSGAPMRVHISATTKAELEDYPYIIEDADSLDIKGKGKMETYWLTGKENTAFKGPMGGMMEEEADGGAHVPSTATTLTHADSMLPR